VSSDRPDDSDGRRADPTSPWADSAERQDDLTPGRGDWTVVLPLKGGPNAKSRLGAPAELATAIALDCLAAVLASDAVGTVVVVTPDPAMAAAAGAAGAVVRSESTPGSGLPAAIRDGLVDVLGPCAVLLGDLPALRPVDLTTALDLVGRQLRLGSGVSGDLSPAMVFVPDAEGTGTVLLAALRPTAMRPAFGPASARAHQAAGGLALEVDLPRLRRDVDTPADLRTAISLGVCTRTRQALAQLPEMGQLTQNHA
jgi:2-phospho-L-lactate guanylyltransferase